MGAAMWRVQVLLMQFAILALGACAAWLGPFQAPLFNVDARAASLPGADDPSNWLYGDANAALETKTYRLNAANAWLDLGRSIQPGADQDAVLDQATIHARGVLAESPTNGYGWIALSWAAYARGRMEEGAVLLALSRVWSPYSRDMALNRVILEMPHWPEMDVSTRQALLHELALARSGRSRTLALSLRDQSSRFRSLWRLSRDLRASKIRKRSEDGVE